MTAAPKELESSLTKLSLHPIPPKSSAAFRKKQSVADSWEDEELEDSDDETDLPVSQQQSVDYPAAPPPTPISPTSRDVHISPYGYGTDGTSDVRSSRDRERENRRPEKTDAVARRMIAGALGVRAPNRTEEQKAYDKAIKEKEIKRRNREKEDAVRAKEEAERAKAAVWAD